MSTTDTTSLDEKRDELQKRIDFLDDPTLGSRANNKADDLREKLDSLESIDADAYERAQEILALRDERDGLDARINRLDDPVIGASDRAEDLRAERGDVVATLEEKEDGFESPGALNLAAEIRGSD